MSRRKKIDPSILEAAKQYDAEKFVENVRGEFVDFPDHIPNQNEDLPNIDFMT